MEDWPLVFNCTPLPLGLGYCHVNYPKFTSGLYKRGHDVIMLNELLGLDEISNIAVL